MDPSVPDGKPDPATIPAWETHLTAGGAVSTFLTCLSAPFSSSYKVFGWVLFAISAALLLLIAVMRLVSGMKLKQKVLLPLVSGMVVICVVAVGLAGWAIVHPPAQAGEVRPASEAAKPGEPATEYRIQTSGTNAPVSTGNHSTITINDSYHAREPGKNRK